MSAESQQVFFDAILEYQASAHPDPALLQAAARGHLGASRPLSDLLNDYAHAMDHEEPHTAAQAAAAQVIADELAPVRLAERIAAGILPPAGGDMPSWTERGGSR